MPTINDENKILTRPDQWHPKFVDTVIAKGNAHDEECDEMMTHA
jgi:hypothetical protein